MKTNTRKQIGGMILSPDWIEDPHRAEPYVRAMADQGYLAYVIFIRHQRGTVLDRRVHDAVKAIVRSSHRRGLKVLLDTDPTFWVPDFVESNPAAALWAIRSVTVPVVDGRFEARVSQPPMPEQIVFQEISAVFRPDGAGYRAVPLSQVRFEWTAVGSPAGIILTGTVRGNHTGPLVFYVAFKTFGMADVASPLYLKAQDRMVASYADVPLDGFGWDEPQKGLGDLSCFRAGEVFMAFFEKQNGYDLRSNLIYLDHLDGTARATVVRCDYYRTLSAMNFNAQDRHNRQARKVLGNHLMFGTHQTWCGIPPDVAAGVMDYFRLGKVLTASWTDGAWIWELKYPAFELMLAEGLKKELGFRDAYYNDWTCHWPMIEEMRFATRFKMLYHVNWFNIFFSDHSESLVNWRVRRVAEAARQDAANLDRFDRFVGADFAPHSDVAWLYLWEGLAAAPKWLTRIFYTSCANSALHLADRGLFATMMGVDSILKARIGKGRFQVGDLTFKVLVVPYGNVLPSAVYRQIRQMWEAGIPVVFTGPLPERMAENGANIGEPLARELGIRPIPFADYQAAYAAQNGVPALNEWEPEWVDFACPVRVTRGIAERDAEGAVVWVKAPDRPLYFLPAPDPREDLTALLQTLVPPCADVYAEDTYHRFFIDPRHPERRVVLAVAKGRIAEAALLPDRYAKKQGYVRPPRKPHPIKALFRIDGQTLDLRGGTWYAVKLERGRVVEAIGDCPEVRWNGIRVTSCGTTSWFHGIRKRPIPRKAT